jgi:hypothetical protein
MSMSKRRLRTLLDAARAELSDAYAEIAAAAPIIAASEDLYSACAWHQRATCEAEADLACAAIDTGMSDLCAAVDARRAGVAEVAAAPPADIPEGWVPDAPAQSPEEVAAFLADYEWPGDEVAA